MEDRARNVGSRSQWRIAMCGNEGREGGESGVGKSSGGVSMVNVWWRGLSWWSWLGAGRLAKASHPSRG